MCLRKYIYIYRCGCYYLSYSACVCVCPTTCNESACSLVCKWSDALRRSLLIAVDWRIQQYVLIAQRLKRVRSLHAALTACMHWNPFLCLCARYTRVPFWLSRTWHTITHLCSTYKQQCSLGIVYIYQSLCSAEFWLFVLSYACSSVTASSLSLEPNVMYELSLFYIYILHPPRRERGLL